MTLINKEMALKVIRENWGENFQFDMEDSYALYFISDVEEAKLYQLENGDYAVEGRDIGQEDWHYWDSISEDEIEKILEKGEGNTMKKQYKDPYQEALVIQENYGLLSNKVEWENEKFLTHLKKVDPDAYKEFNRLKEEYEAESSKEETIVYVAQLDSKVQKRIEKELRTALEETGLYNKEEIKEHVQNGMDSKIHDLTDTIDIDKIIENAEKEKKKVRKHGFDMER